VDASIKQDDKGSSGVRPLAFKSKADAVYQEIRQRILDGKLLPSSTLNQEQLAATLEVSTTPLREALRRLETEGLVRSTAHRDITVASLSLEEFTSLWEVREELDAMAVALAARRYTPDDRERMRSAAEAMSKDGDHHRNVELNREFHTAIYYACHNLVLIELLNVLWDRADRYRRLITATSSATGTALEHQTLLGLVLDRRAKEAARLMRGHLRQSGELIEQSLKG
jgi:DNA-binding GntR family transcriptional regulator